MSEQNENGSQQAPDMNEFAQQHPLLVTLRYTVFRAMLLIAFGVVFYLIGLRDLILLMAAFVASGAVSLFLLNRQRAVMSVGVSSVFTKVNKKIENSKSAEDVD
ncbi:MAG: hypothetical protein RIS75_183 [Actinomycetota bacterium]|jgi:hypothetical protein